MIRKSCFNLIEILLAISIIAIGLSSAMALFTAGVRTGQETISETNLPDACETILAHIRGELVRKEKEDGFDTLDSVAPVVADADWNEVKNDVCHFDSSLFGEDSSDGESIKKDGTAGANGFYLYRQLTKKGTKYATSFSALARVRRAAHGGAVILSNPSGPAGAKWEPTIKDADGSTDISARCRVRVEVRISYPADFPPEQRQSKTFTLEVFNEKYNRAGFETDSPGGS